MNIEAKISQLLEEPDNYSVDDLYMMDESLASVVTKIVKSPAAANKYLSENLAMFGTIDNILKNAERKIDKIQTARKKELGDKSWVYSTSQKILKFLIGNPLAQMAILCIFAAGGYQLIVSILSLVRTVFAKASGVFKTAVGGFASLVMASPGRGGKSDPSRFTPPARVQGRRYEEPPEDIAPYRDTLSHVGRQTVQEVRSAYDRLFKLSIGTISDFDDPEMIEILNNLMLRKGDIPYPKNGSTFAITFQNREIICLDGRRIAGWESFPARAQRRLLNAIGRRTQPKWNLSASYGPHGLPREYVGSQSLPKAHMSQSAKKYFGKIFTFKKNINVFPKAMDFSKQPEHIYKNGPITIPAKTRVQLMSVNSKTRLVVLALPDTGEFAYTNLEFLLQYVPAIKKAWELSQSSGIVKRHKAKGVKVVKPSRRRKKRKPNQPVQRKKK